ncbi:PadR family transcriptional regulator [Glutamicibacter sp. AGC46]
MSVRQWRNDFARSALQYAALAVIAEEDIHGYELIVRLREHGFGDVKGGVLYPLLRRFEEQGALEHYWDTTSHGPAKKMLRLTGEGRDELLAAEQAWQDISRSLSMINKRS